MSRFLQVLGTIVTVGIIVVMLAGCATTSTVPPSLLICAPQPPSPAPESQQVVGIFVIDVVEAGADCRSKLGAVRRLHNPGD